MLNQEKGQAGMRLQRKPQKHTEKSNQCGSGEYEF